MGRLWIPRGQFMSEEKNSVKLADIESTETPKIVMDRQAIEAAVNLNSQTMYKNYQYLRVYLEGKGCDGFTYGVSFDDLDCKYNSDNFFPKS